MSFVWPQALWLLLLVPALIAGYLWLLKRRHSGVRYANIGLVREALGTQQRFRRHIPPLLFLIGLVLAILAIARPNAIITLPSEERTLILVMDVSLSMRATDVEPSRIVAAQTAAKAFVQEQPSDVRIGVVEFAGAASLAQPPTHSREDIIAAIDRFQLQRHTAIGSGIIVALAALFPDQGIDISAATTAPWSPYRDRAPSRPIEKPKEADKPPPAPVPPGSYTSAAIILLTDGRRTTGPDPLDAARMAAERGVRVYTVGFGSATGGYAGYEGMSYWMRFDEESLRAIADITRGEFFHAKTATDLKQIYDKLNTKFVLERKYTEITAISTGIAAIFVLLALGLSLLWFNRSR